MLYIHIGGRQVYSLLEDTAHSGSVQLGQGASVPEVADFLLVKAFLMLVEALEMVYREDLFD